MLGKAEEKKIVDTWCRQFPSMTAFRSMWLVRRLGPYVQGIHLEVDSSRNSYMPITHLHSLCVPSEEISLSLGQALLSRNGSHDRISEFATEERTAKAMVKLAADCLLPLAGDVAVEAIQTAYGRYRRLGVADARYPRRLFEDEIALYAWLGDEMMVARRMREMLAEVETWPPGALRPHGSVRAWEAFVVETATDGVALRRIVVEQAASLRVNSLPVSEILVG